MTREKIRGRIRRNIKRNTRRSIKRNTAKGTSDPGVWSLKTRVSIILWCYGHHHDHHHFIRIKKKVYTRRVHTRRCNIFFGVNHFLDRMMIRSDWRPTSACIFSLLNWSRSFPESVFFVAHLCCFSLHDAMISAQERRGGMNTMIILIHSLSNLMISNSNNNKKKRPRNNNNIQVESSAQGKGLGQSPLNCFPMNSVKCSWPAFSFSHEFIEFTQINFCLVCDFLFTRFIPFVNLLSVNLSVNLSVDLSVNLSVNLV